MSTHTPGPWKATGLGVSTTTDSDAGPGTLLVARCGVEIEVSGRTRRNIPSNEAIANARLIAAAPELLAALRRLTDRVDPATKTSNTIKSFSQAIDAARAAIAKAGVR